MISFRLHALVKKLNTVPLSCKRHITGYLPDSGALFHLNPNSTSLHACRTDRDPTSQMFKAFSDRCNDVCFSLGDLFACKC